MVDYSVIGWFDLLGFPTGYHALLEGDTTTPCGLSGEIPGSRMYVAADCAVTCQRCLDALVETATICEPVEFL